MAARSPLAVRVWLTAWVVEAAASATVAMFAAISPEPAEASATLRDISSVVAVCCSTAEAIVSWWSLIELDLDDVADQRLTSIGRQGPDVVEPLPSARSACRVRT